MRCIWTWMKPQLCLGSRMKWTQPALGIWVANVPNYTSQAVRVLPNQKRVSPDASPTHFQYVRFVRNEIHMFLIHLHLNHQDVTQWCLCDLQISSAFFFNLKKENHILQSVDLKPQICTMKKNVCLLFSFFSLPSFKGGIANLQTHDFQKHLCQPLLPESPCLSHYYCGLLSWESVCVLWGRGWREDDLERNW